MRNQLYEIYYIPEIKIKDKKVSIDSTVKYLFELHDSECIESVVMKYKHGYSICISTQAGCKMGCSFCQTGKGGFVRNLSPSEMLLQIEKAQEYLNIKISNIVLMGMGEPLDNYENLLKFLRMLTDENGQNLSMRNVTVSTCGIVPRIYDLAREKLSITLALSLHATTDERRREIMPIANTYTISECMAACRYYFEETGRRVTFEYSLIKGVNDSLRDAKELAALAGSISAHINLIPVNPVRERDYEQPDLSAVQAFRAKLEKHGINVSIRRVLGRDIDGACGQLRHRHIEISG